ATIGRRVSDERITSKPFFNLYFSYLICGSGCDAEAVRVLAAPAALAGLADCPTVPTGAMNASKSAETWMNLRSIGPSRAGAEMRGDNETSRIKRCYQIRRFSRMKASS